jgi:ATP-dependent Lhr-like helicase
LQTVFERLHESLQEVLVHRLGWDDLREVQEKTYLAVSGGNDVLVIAPTAGGKTEAALIPVTDGILSGGLSGVACIYLSPLKALINDQEERFNAFSVPCGLEVAKWHGDVPKGDRSWARGEPPHFLLITPESLEVMLQEENLTGDLKSLRYVIVDEVHAFVESERGVHLKVLLDRLDRCARRRVQRIGLSATVGNPEEILSWLSGRRGGKELVRVPVPPREKHFSFVVENDEQKRMQALAGVIAGKKAIVFVNSRKEAEEISRALKGRVEHLSVHHSSLSPQMRKAAEEAFSREGSACIISTSTLELGIDIGDLDIVVQVGNPGTVSSFLQRMGRTGRRGKPPHVACILKDRFELLCMAAVIECASKKEVEPLIPQEKPYNVLVQQVLLETVRSRRTSKRHIMEYIRGLSPFGGIPPEDVDLLVEHLIRAGFFIRDGDLLMPGPGAEQLFGRSNWKDLYSVIRGGGEFRAVTPDGEVVGKLDSRFVSARAGESFSLGGSSWTMVKSDESPTLVRAGPAAEQQVGLFWTGTRAGISPVVCRGIQRIVARGRSSLPLPEERADELESELSRFPPVRSRGLHLFERPSARTTEVVLQSFRGEQYNGVLSRMLGHFLGKPARLKFSDLEVTVSGLKKDGGIDLVHQALSAIQELIPEEAGEILPLPAPDHWKFGQALPGAMLRDMALADFYHLDRFCDSIRKEKIYLIDAGPPS